MAFHRPKENSGTFMTQVRVRRKLTKQEARVRALKNRPPWVETSTRGAAPTPDMMVTHINQTHDSMVSKFLDELGLNQLY